MNVSLIEILQHLEELQENGLGEIPGVHEGEYSSSEDPSFTTAFEEFKQRVQAAPVEELRKAMTYVEGRFSEVMFNAEFFKTTIEGNLN